MRPGAGPATCARLPLRLPAGQPSRVAAADQSPTDLVHADGGGATGVLATLVAASLDEVFPDDDAVRQSTDHTRSTAGTEAPIHQADALPHRLIACHDQLTIMIREPDARRAGEAASAVRPDHTQVQ